MDNWNHYPQPDYETPSKEEKFYDTLTNYFSGSSWLLSGGAKRIEEELVRLNNNFEKADESSTKLTKALNRITLAAAIIAALSVLIAWLNFILSI